MAIDFKDYYAVLGVSREATGDEIKQAFRRLARQYHPDVAKEKKTAEEKFKAINEANEVLSDPEKRRKYDELGANWQQTEAAQEAASAARRNGARGNTPEFNFGGSTGFSDFFEQFFGGGGRSHGSHYQDMFRQAGADESAEFRMPGTDIEGDILVTLNESLRGSSRQISLQRTEARTGQAATETFTVRIPPGATEGRRIRVRGKGGQGSGGAAAGDLFLRIRLAAHPDFEARGIDLYHELALAPWEAVLGAQVVVPTLSGQVKLRVPPGTHAGRQFRVRGQGLPKTGADERGDLFIVARIRVPTELTDQERTQWEELARISRFNPRDEPA
jgi:curved DNA-binding protein